MSDSKREGILAQIVTTVTSATNSLVSGRVYRSRAQALSRADSPAVYVKPVADNRREIVVPYSERDLFVELGIVTRGSIPEQDADPIAVALHAALFADTTLGGRSIDIEESDTTFESLDVDADGGVTRMRFRIYYRHMVENLDQ